jgi:hypothetical protein
MSKEILRPQGKPAQPEPEQEPVAWMDADGNVSDNNDHKCFPIPLYTTANIQSYLEKDNSQPEQNEFALRGKLANLLCWHRLTQAEEDDLLRFAAAQRKPLTREEIWSAIRPLTKSDEVCKALIDVSMDEYRAIEAAHDIKEKNT